MNILKEVKDSWGWVGIDPVEVVAENDFGNLILKDADDRFWRLCPEEVYCKIIANSIEEYNELIKDEEFNIDWFMDTIINEAKELLGPLKDGHKYYLVVPGILDGDYTGTNIQSAPFYKIIQYSGDIGLQVKDLPDGAEVILKPIK
ncbi:MAG: DUF1851 domain-containing protein [Gammaproteobacteria bacterium]|nr:DUF1851 domain-containing protein [Gammaproteobacteria bacterium]MDH5651893.1 DUF1851 domain-containing protein [Gammaproteobacteria bacterium]